LTESLFTGKTCLVNVIELTGTTWRHTRGYLPMVATAQRFAELNPEVLIRWDFRSLQQFADFPIQELAKRYDLLVIDHPFSGYAAAHDVLAPLDEWLPASFLTEQASHSVGLSHQSYSYGNHQWALAIDAATPISGWRPDLLERAKAQVPETWSELLELAARGMVAVPAIAIDSLMHFYMLCGALGENPFQDTGRIVAEDIGAQALSMLRKLLSVCGPECLARNPIATWQLLSEGDTVAYCPFAYGYSNYSRRGYSRHQLQVGGLVSLDDTSTVTVKSALVRSRLSSGTEPRAPASGRIESPGQRTSAFRSTLGGAGLAISNRCQHKPVASQYAQFVAGGDCQKSLYFDSGGQPGHRQAWLDTEVNRRSNNFFRDTLPTLDSAWLRPRFDGYLDFQDHAAPVVHKYLTGREDEKAVLVELNRLLHATQGGE
jgi:multiple sugar transport system substrate-binding protein